MACTSCDQPTDANTLVCSGPCGNSYHITCIPAKDGLYKNAVATYVKSITNLRWFCDHCLPLTMKAPEISAELELRVIEIKKFADALLTSLALSTSTTQNDISSQIQIEQNALNRPDATNLNGSFSSAMSTEHMDDTQTPNSQMPELSPASSHVTLRPKRGPPSSPHSSQIAKQAKIANVQTVLADLIANPKEMTIADLVAKPKQKTAPIQNVTIKTNMVRSIYISPFAPSVKASDIIGILEKEDDLKHIVPNVKCKKLLRRGQRVNFVSFKLDVRRDQFEIIMASPVWKQTGIDNFTITEFTPKPNVNATGSNANDGNPFSRPSCSRNDSIRPPKCQKNANSQSQRQPKPNHIVNRRSPPRQNFCQKDCCNRVRPLHNRWPKRFDGNRFASQQCHYR